jgi:hypothetical protein
MQPFALNADGIERVFGMNHVAHFLLSRALAVLREQDFLLPRTSAALREHSHATR